MCIRSMNPLNACLVITPLLKDWYEQEISVCLMDSEKVLYNYNMKGMEKIPIYSGQPIGELTHTVGYQALVSGQKIITRQDKGVLGIPYIAIANPIKDGERTVGSLTIIMSTEKHDSLIASGEEVLALVEEISDTSECLAAASQQLAASCKTMNQDIADLAGDLKDISNITDEMKKVSMQSNILGINASIEAARAAERGWGFSVVADEIRKLAEGTKLSAVQIEKNISHIRNSVGKLIEIYRQLSCQTESQADGITDIDRTLSQLTQMADRLVQMGKV